MKHFRTQVMLLFWAVWIFVSSCTVITRKQFVGTASTVLRADEDKVLNAWEYVWWVFVKGYHVLEFAVLTLLLILAIRSLRNRPWLAGMIAFAYACTDEFHQTFVKARGGHFSDVIIDSLGIIAVVAFFTFKKRK
jgi:hypothetical protein